MLVLCLGLVASWASPPAARAQVARSAHEALRAGDDAFRKKDFAAAELHYRRAEELEPSFQSAYNLGVTLGYLARADEAAAAFEDSRERAKAARDRGDASFNAGTARLDEQEFEASVEAYAQALRANPRDEEARQNLAHALRQLRRQQQQQQQQRQSEQPPQDQQEQQQQQQQQEQPRDPDEQQDRQQPPQQEPQNPQSNDRSGDGEAPEPPASAEPSEGESDDQPAAEEPSAPTEGQGKRPLPADEAERLLQIAADQERRTNEKMRFGESQPYRPSKDW